MIKPQESLKVDQELNDSSIAQHTPMMAQGETRMNIGFPAGTSKNLH
ncbi:MAG: hypothetical protein U5R46_11915 [Gammaproteobacteria bacterium]|nr:hypothetical protein [Gammaproteobacteria bacterium]